MSTTLNIGAGLNGACNGKNLIVVQPVCEFSRRNTRMNVILNAALERLTAEGIQVTVIDRIAELEEMSMKNQRVLFAICLSEAGVNMEYYRLLEYFRASEDCLDGAVGGIIVDGASELYTKALARRLAFSANLAGCTLPGKSLVEATGSLGNFHVLSGIRGVDPLIVYKQQVLNLVQNILEFNMEDARVEGRPMKILAIHASSRKASNTLLLWDKIKSHLGDRADVKEISIRNGTLPDCRGCRYEECLHFGENDRCFYGGIMTEQVYPAILECDVLVMICPNYNDALTANLTAFINRLTALFRAHDFSKKKIHALVVSGYSGGDIIAEQIIGALNFNKGFILPGRFAMVETANDPRSILAVENIDERAGLFADSIK